MSRVGTAPITVPGGVDISIDGASITVKGSKGELSRELPGGVSVSLDESTLTVARPDDSKESRAFHGLSRSLIQNMIVGVTEGYKKDLQIVGVGWGANLKGNKVELNVGYADTRVVEVPQGVTAEVKGQDIKISGADKQLVGQTAAKIREHRKPEPYNGKGIMYTDERVLRKQGKAFGG